MNGFTVTGWGLPQEHHDQLTQNGEYERIWIYTK